MSKIKLSEKLTKAGKDLLIQSLTMLGPAASAYLGSLVHDPSSIMVSAAIGQVISNVTNDFSMRVLSSKERRNISLTELSSLSQIVRNQNAGLTLNEDIFNNQPGNANELYTGALIAAKNNYEDKKVEFIGRFLGNVLFAPWFEQRNLNNMLTLLESLNYNQLCIISLVAQNRNNLTTYRASEDLLNEEGWFNVHLFQNELSNLINRNLLLPANGSALMEPLDRRHINKCKISNIGKLLYDIASLEDIESEDICFVNQLFI